MRLDTVAPLAMVGGVLVLNRRPPEVLLQNRRRHLGGVGWVAVCRHRARSNCHRVSPAEGEDDTKRGVEPRSSLVCVENSLLTY
jgi:hypothetical protein